MKAAYIENEADWLNGHPKYQVLAVIGGCFAADRFSVAEGSTWCAWWIEIIIPNQQMTSVDNRANGAFRSSFISASPPGHMDIT